MATGGHDFGHIKVTPAGHRTRARLTIGDPHDRYEREAERIATAVTGARGPGEAASPGAPVDSIQPNRPPEHASGGSATQEASGPLETHARSLAGGGRPLDDTTRRSLEPKFGFDFGRVRIHTDQGAAGAALSMGARAFTLGSDIAFAPGEFRPETASGRWLIAHELTHVAQQGSVPTLDESGNGVTTTATGGERVQRGIFGDIWEGIKSVGSAIGGAISTAAEWVGGALTTAAEWVGGRLADLGMWVVNLIRDLPERLARFAEALASGFAGVISFIPEAIAALASGGISGFGDWLWEKAKQGLAWVHRMVMAAFDLLGGPELVEFIMHAFSKATPLTTEETDAGKLVLGDDAVRWGDVRVAEGGFLLLVHALNGGRAFTSFHTINIPSTGDHSRTHLDIMVHELTHVYQFEKVGSRYLGEAIHAQATIGYGYGGAAGLDSDRAAGKHYSSYNREQQAQIAQDYYKILIANGDTTSYDPYITEMRSGDI